MKTLFIKDIQKGQILESAILGVGKVDELKDKNGKIYYGIEFQDKTGTLQGKIWSDKIERIERSCIAPSKIVKISGPVSEFRGEVQVIVSEMFEVTDEMIDLNDFVQSSPRPAGEMWEDFLGYVNQIQTPEIRKLIDNFLDKWGEDFKQAPAAERLHHAYFGGLLEHVLELFSLMGVIKKHYPEADYDIVTAGIILHDIGKIRELVKDGFTIRRSIEGKLLGHLSMSFEMVNEIFPDEMTEAVRMKIKHVILSHHGILEYGSPVVPMTLEAIIVHKLDDLSGSVRQYKRVKDESGDADFSSRDWALGTEVYLR